MKKLLFLALLLIATIGAKADEITGALKVAADKQTATLHVSLTNELSYVAFQMDVTLPEGWTVTSAAPVGSSRLDGTGDGSQVGDTKFNLAYNVIGGNKLRVLAYNLANDIIKGTKGEELFTVKLTKQDDAPANISDWSVTFSNVEFVTETDLAEIEMSVTQNTIYGENEATLGDVNKDTKVSTADISAVLNIINGKAANYDYDLDAADVNKDTRISVADISALITIINKK